MSYWTYISGAITVSPMGRTQPEKRYILDTILEHLPKVTGSEHDMSTHVIQMDGYDGSSGCNEFGELNYDSSHRFKPVKTQDNYIIILEARLRDCMFEETLRELNKWLNRLAKRVMVRDIVVKLRGWNKELVISNPKPYEDMQEGPSWYNGEIAWAEYLIWDRAKDYDYPMKLLYKYVRDPENDAEVERRMVYEKGE